MAATAQFLRKPQASSTGSEPTPLSLAWLAIYSFLYSLTVLQPLPSASKSIPLIAKCRQLSRQGLQSIWPPALHPTLSLFIPVKLPSLLGRSSIKRHYHKLITPLSRNHCGVAGREVTIFTYLPFLCQD